MKNTRILRVCEGGAPRLPNGQRVGTYSSEDGHTVWTRNVCQKHLLRFLDAWTINDTIVQQLLGDAVYLIRYVSREGTYTVTLERFLAEVILLPAFACDEDVYALPRDKWEFKSESGSQLMLLLKGRDDY